METAISESTSSATESSKATLCRRSNGRSLVLLDRVINFEERGPTGQERKDQGRQDDQVVDQNPTVQSGVESHALRPFADQQSEQQIGQHEPQVGFAETREALQRSQRPTRRAVQPLDGSPGGDKGRGAHQQHSA